LFPNSGHFYVLAAFFPRSSAEKNRVPVKQTMASSANLAIDDVFVSSRGAKSARIKDGDAPLVHIPDAYLRVPFEPSSFVKDPTATRLNICLDLPPESEAFVRAFDEWAIQYLADHSERLFKKQMAAQEVRAGYNSCLKASDKGFQPTLKCKIDTFGPKAVSCWDSSNGQPIDNPVQWRNRNVKPRLVFSHMYFMGNSFGPVIRLTDASLSPDDRSGSMMQRACPF
jgi:hypothetical protein